MHEGRGGRVDGYSRWYCTCTCVQVIRVSHTWCVGVLAINVHNIFRVIHHDDVYYLLDGILIE